MKARLALGILALAAGGGCRRAPPPAPAASYRTVADYFELGVGGRVVRVQLAVRPDEMERGLMFRRDLAPDDGMLFVYASPQRMNFWMRNTPTALDIGYFGPDGTLQEVYPMYPYDERPVASESREVQFALEMRQGWFARNGVRPGARLDLGALRAALQARGFGPGRFGL